MKVYGALEVAQLEWFTNAARPAAASYIYRVIYVSDLKQIQVSDGTNWIPFLNTSTNQTLSGDITFSGQQIFNGLHRLSVTTNSATGAITALAPTTPITEFTGAVTSVSGITSGASGATVMLINRSGSPFTVLDEDTGATAGNRIRTGTGASITLTNNASIMLSYAGDSRWHVVGGTGSSAASGTKNYFSTSSANPNFSQNSVSPWSACTLSFLSGVPSGLPTLTATQMAISPSPTNPLVASQSSYNLLLTKSANNAQYQGFISGELTIDREDLAKVLTGSFAYEVTSSSTSVDFSGTSTQSLEIWIYNTVSGVWTQPAGYRGMNTSSGTGIVTFTFQTDSTAANNKYKIAIITQQTSATGYTVNFNDFKIGPTAVINGTPVTDWATYTPTFQGFTSFTSSDFQWRRVGGNIEIRGKFVSSSIGNASELQIGFPFSLKSNIPSIQMVGSFQSGDIGSVAQGVGVTCSVLSEPAVGYLTFSTRNNTLSGLTKIAGSTAIAAGVTYSLFASVPIQGWSSNVQVSSDTDTRVVAASYSLSTTTTFSATIIKYDSKFVDTHGAYNSTTGIYTVPVAGLYRVSVTAYSSSTTVGVFIRKNSTSLVRSEDNTATNDSTCTGVVITQCNAGDTIDFFTNLSTSFYGAGAPNNYMSIERLSGPSVVAASETVAASYWATATPSISGGNPFQFDGKEYDTHNAVTTGSSWKFTAPISGKYSIKSFLNSSTVPGGSLYFYIYKNGSNYATMGFSTATTANSAVYTINLNAGDYISINPNITYVMNGNASRASPGICSIQIERVGN